MVYFGTRYVKSDSKEALLRYKYSVIDMSLIYKHFTNHYFYFLLQFLPHWMGKRSLVFSKSFKLLSSEFNHLDWFLFRSLWFLHRHVRQSNVWRTSTDVGKDFGAWRTPFSLNCFEWKWLTSKKVFLRKNDFLDSLSPVRWLTIEKKEILTSVLRSFSAWVL